MSMVAQYKILETIAEHGSLGSLFRARDERTGRTVALRIVRSEIAGDPERREALLSDVRSAVGVSHPHVASLYEAGEADGTLFLAHEYVPGQPLAALLSDRPLDQQAALEFAIQAADALCEARRHNLVHGDIQPSSIMVTPKDQVKILDLGLGAWTTGTAARREAAARLACGDDLWNAAEIARANEAAWYLSPEQALGGAADHRTDIFSLGIVLYRMLTGQAPFSGASDASTALKIVQATPAPATRINPAIASQFDTILGRALAKSFDGRYRDAGDLANDLRDLAAALRFRVLSERQRREAPAAAEEEPGGTASRSRVVMWMVVLLLLALGALAVFGRGALGAMLGLN